MSVSKFRYDGVKPPAERKTYKNEVNKFFTIKLLPRLSLQKNSNWILIPYTWTPGHDGNGLKEVKNVADT